MGLLLCDMNSHKIIGQYLLYEKNADLMHRLSNEILLQFQFHRLHHNVTIKSRNPLNCSFMFTWTTVLKNASVHESI